MKKMAFWYQGCSFAQHQSKGRVEGDGARSCAGHGTDLGGFGREPCFQKKKKKLPSS